LSPYLDLPILVLMRVFKSLTLSLSVNVLTLGLASPSFADLDPVSPFIRGGGSSPTIETLDSNRFSVKPSDERRGSIYRSPRSEVQVTTKPQSPPPSLAEEKKTIKVEVKESEEVIAEKPPTEPSPEKASGSEVTHRDTNFLERLRILILGVNDDEFKAIKLRQKKNGDGENSVEISLSPTYFYYNSSSSYSVRNLSSSAPGYSVGLNLWISPYFGIEGKAQASMGSSVASLTDNSVSSLTLSHNRIGLSFRNIDLDNQLSPQTTWMISYVDNSATTSGSTGGRVSTQSSGFQVAFEAQLPSSPNYSHLIGVSIDPKLTHKESSGVQNYESGQSNVSTAISANIGGRIKFDRKNQVFWLVEHRFEKNLFKGAATRVDPENGTLPDGLSVNQSLTLFSIGYRWGK
ncbi:hypothetical protein GW916_08795, partial [bacterium]|nr:hypothetical protein [bacterium]